MSMLKKKRLIAVLAIISILLVVIFVIIFHNLSQRNKNNEPAPQAQQEEIIKTPNDSGVKAAPSGYEAAVMLDSEYKEKISAAKSDIEITETNEEFAEKWKSEINTNYEKLSAVASDGFKEKLTESQAEWNIYAEKRTAEHFEYLLEEYESGTIVPVIQSEFEYRLYRERAIELFEMYSKLNSLSMYDVKSNGDLFPIKTYASLEIPYPNDTQSDFDKEMNGNPIDSKMKPQLNNIMSASAAQQQSFFDSYLKLWVNELEQSLSDLKSYLSESEIDKLNQSQQQWEDAILYNDEFEKSVIANNDINLGTQAVSSNLITKIEKYRERCFYIRYLTMLIEQYRIDPVPEEKQLWCKWSVE